MRIEVSLPLMQVPLADFPKVIPRESHLKKLQYLPPIKPAANRRVIIPDICSNEITGYAIHDFIDRLYQGMEYFPIERLDDMPDLG